MSKYNFNASGDVYISNVLPDHLHPTEQDVHSEPALVNCDLAHARQLGGPITNNILDLLPISWAGLDIVVASRVTQLMPGWFPSLPGWHTDDVPRSLEQWQPDYLNQDVRSNHFLMILGMEECRTQFALGKFDETVLDNVPEGVPVFQHCHDAIERQIREGTMKVHTVTPGHLIAYTDREWHRAVQSTGYGWRFFIRISTYFDNTGAPIPFPVPRTNEIQRNCPIYLPTDFRGW